MDQRGSAAGGLHRLRRHGAPPDCPHQYELRVYALDCLLPLEQGFLYGELYRAMEGHLLDSCALRGRYRA